MGTDIMQNLRLNLVLLGRTGVGKSSSGNTILGRPAFSSTGTRRVAAEIGNVCRLPITVYDTPGFSETELTKEDRLKYEEVLQKCESGLCAFLLVLRADRFTAEDQEALEKIEELLGAKRIQNTWILFTRGDELEEENKTIHKVIKGTEYLKNLAQKYEGKHHVLNNKNIRRRDDEVKSLLSKVLHRNLENLPKRQRIPVSTPKIPVNSLSSRRIVLLGKSGVGKSAAGNTILGQTEFISAVGSNSVTSKCSVAHSTVSGRSVSVVDTPGLFDTQMNPDQLMMEIARSVYISSPGPHAFLIVFPVNRFTQQEEEIPQIIEMLFGHEVLKYSIILFTHGDQLEGRSIEEIIEENEALRDLVDQCGGRYHVFNNKNQNNREQVNDLLQKIETMIGQNGGGHYSNPMYEDAYRYRQEGLERVRKETEQRVRAEIQHENNERQQQEEIQRQKEIEKVRRQTEERVRADCEAQMKFEMERIKAERQREEEQRKQQEKQRQEEIERVRKETEQRIRAEIQREINERQKQEKIQRRKETEKVRRQTEQRVRAECEAQMKSEMERIKAERLREEEQRKQQEKQRQEDIERVIKATEKRVRAEIQSEINAIFIQKDEKTPENTPESEERSGFKKFFSKYWKYFVMGIAAGAIIGGGVVGGVIGGVVGGVVALIVDKRQERR